MSEKTRRLFDEDVTCTVFTARVLSCEPAGEGWDAVLDATAFFPEGGGQGADRGTLGGARVLDAQERAGVIFHRVDAPLAVGETVRGEVDRDRRLSMMQQHTGEHILTGIIHRIHGYDNVGFHIGTDAVTVDFNGPLTEEQLREAEDLANACVWRDEPVRVWFPSPEELATLEYRSKKAIDGDVRICAIEGADVCACCGTHCLRTGQVGQIRIVSAIHYKGGMRLSILCGGRALAWEQAQSAENRAVSHALSAKPGELAEAVERLLRERDALARQAEDLAVRDLEHTAAAEAGKPVRLAVSDCLPPAHLRKAAGSLAEGAVLGLVLLPRGEGWQFALSGAGDVRPAAKALCARFGGKGGGAPDMVQGMLAGGTPADIRAALEEIAEGQKA